MAVNVFHIDAFTVIIVIHKNMVVYRTINGVNFGVNISKGSGLLCSPEIAEIIDGDIYEFIEYLYNQKKVYTPMVATWEITNCCNFKCPFCYINTPSKPESKVQTFSEMKGYIDDLADKGLLLVYLTGGEVLSVPDFEKIYCYLKNKGIFVVLLSNLSLLNEDHIALFKELPPLRITASIYGLTEQQFTAVTSKDYSYCQKILDNILLLKELGIIVTCQMPVNKYTVSDLLPIADWCYSNGIRFTYNNEITDSYYNESRSSDFIDDEQFDRLRGQIKQIEAVKSSKVISIEKKFGYKHHFDCISGRHTFAISYNGHLRPCFNIWESDCHSFDGSVSMKEAMQSMVEHIYKMQSIAIDGCHGCEASQICGECVYTRLKHKKNTDEYIKTKCAENLAKVCKLLSK